MTIFDIIVDLYLLIGICVGIYFSATQCKSSEDVIVTTLYALLVWPLLIWSNFKNK